MYRICIEKATFVDGRLHRHDSDVLYGVPLKQSLLSTVAAPVVPEGPTEQPTRGKWRKRSAAQDDGRIYLYLRHDLRTENE